MSLHKYYPPPPPLALGINPAPVHKSSREKEKEKERAKEKERQIEEEKAKQKDKEKEKNGQGGKKDKDGEAGQAGKAGMDEADVRDQGDDKADVTAENKAKGNGEANEPNGNVETPPSPATPYTPSTMIPEPPTPGDNPFDLPSPTPDNEITPVPGPSKPKDTAKDVVEAVPESGVNGTKEQAQAEPVSKDIKDTKDTKGNEDTKETKKTKETKDPKDIKEAKESADIEKFEEEEQPKPIRLLGPIPHKPLRTRLALDPTRPYPPIYTDPRGAYHKYAKFMTNEWILIDVTKDGWLAPQWKEKSEREALARLRGEVYAQAEKERELIRKERVKRKVPNSAQGILLDLWNDLAVAPREEVSLGLEFSKRLELMKLDVDPYR